VSRLEASRVERGTPSLFRFFAVEILLMDEVNISNPTVFPELKCKLHFQEVLNPDFENSKDLRFF
jgi:hypothetical protein